MLVVNNWKEAEQSPDIPSYQKNYKELNKVSIKNNAITAKVIFHPINLGSTIIQEKPQYRGSTQKRTKTHAYYVARIRFYIWSAKPSINAS